MDASSVRKLSVLFPWVVVRIKRDNAYASGLEIIKVCELEPWYCSIKWDERAKASLWLVFPAVLLPVPVFPPPGLGACTCVCLVWCQEAKARPTPNAGSCGPGLAVQSPQWVGFLAVCHEDRTWRTAEAAVPHFGRCIQVYKETHTFLIYLPPNHTSVMFVTLNEQDQLFLLAG